MDINSRNYEWFIDEYFKVLPEYIDIRGDELTVEDFNVVTNTQEAKEAKNVIYIWKTERSIPRVVGSSNIVYIGQTKRSIFRRHGYSSLKAQSKANKLKYNEIVKRYGKLSISYIELDLLNQSNDLNLLQAEGQFLWWYFRNHCEYPPINYTKTRVRNEVLTYVPTIPG